jgi:hypothetical protein
VSRCDPIGAAWNIGTSSNDGVVVRGIAGIIVLHTLRRGELELSSSLETKSSSLGNSSRMACSDGDPLRVMPPNPVPKFTAFEWPIQVVEAVGLRLE